VPEAKIGLAAVPVDDDRLAAAVVEPHLVVSVEDLQLEAAHRRLDRADRRAVAELRRAVMGFGG